jgi:hypothetical protein
MKFQSELNRSGSCFSCLTMNKVDWKDFIYKSFA